MTGITLVPQNGHRFNKKKNSTPPLVLRNSPQNTLNSDTVSFQGNRVRNGAVSLTTAIGIAVTAMFTGCATQPSSNKETSAVVEQEVPNSTQGTPAKSQNPPASSTPVQTTPKATDAPVKPAVTPKPEIPTVDKFAEVDKKNIAAGAPSSKVTIKGVDYSARIVVSKKEHTTFVYDKDGVFVKKFANAVGAKGSETDEGIRQVTGIFKHPYKELSGLIHEQPDLFGPFAILDNKVDPITGKITYTAEWLHGTNNPASIGTDASHGCVRHLNEQIKEIIKYVAPGDYIKIISQNTVKKAEALKTTAQSIDKKALAKKLSRLV